MDEKHIFALKNKQTPKQKNNKKKNKQNRVITAASFGNTNSIQPWTIKSHLL